VDRGKFLSLSSESVQLILDNCQEISRGATDERILQFFQR
jgi:hypothetical protein